MKNFLAIFNWKMNPSSLKEALFIASQNDIKTKNVEVVVCPPFIFLSDIKKSIQNIKVGAQNCFFENQGSFTGETSPLMLKNLKIEYVILGHCERRLYFGETDEIISKKIKAVEVNGIYPILCVGENQKEKEKNLTFKVLKKQLQPILKIQRKPIIVAYEPVWAVGGNKPEEPSEIKKIKNFIYDFTERYGKIKNKDIKILYGGTVNDKNIKTIMEKGNVDGVLVGRASLYPKQSLKIIKILEKINADPR